MTDTKKLDIQQLIKDGRKLVQESRANRERIDREMAAKDKQFEEEWKEFKKGTGRYSSEEIKRWKTEQAARPGLGPQRMKELLEGANAAIERSRAIDRRQKELINDGEEERLVKEMDAIYEETGRQLKNSVEAELSEFQRINRELDLDEQDDEEEDASEQRGSPPPVRRIK